MSNFEIASRKKLRFETVRGHLTVEQIWDVPLKSNDDFNLDAIASKLDAEIKGASSGSFFGSTDKRSATKKELDELRLEIIKRIHAVRSAEEDKRKTAAENKVKRQKLAELLAKKRDESVEAMTEAQIMAELEKMDKEESEG